MAVSAVRIIQSPSPTDCHAIPNIYAVAARARGKFVHAVPIHTRRPGAITIM